MVVIGATAGRMALMKDDGTTNQQITAFELLTDRVIPLFLLRQLRFAENWLRASASTATIPILDTNIVTHLSCAIAPIDEQIAITDYLTEQMRKISRAIHAVNHSINLLKQYRTRLIADVVTGKMDVREAAQRLEEAMPQEAEALEAAE